MEMEQMERKRWSVKCRWSQNGLCTRFEILGTDMKTYMLNCQGYPMACTMRECEKHQNNESEKG